MKWVNFFLFTLLLVLLWSFRVDPVRWNVASIVAMKTILNPASGSSTQDDLRLVEYFLQPAITGTDIRLATRAHLMLGLLYDRAGDRQHAIEEWRLANSPSLWEGLSSIAWSQGHHDDAIEYLKEAIAVAPSRLENYFMLAWLYWPGTGRVDEAIKVYEETARIAAPGSFERYLAEAQVFRLQRNWAQALDKFEWAVRINPSRGDVHRLAASVADEMGSYQVAVDHLKQAINLTPYDNCIYVELGDVYRDAGQYPEASSWYSKAARIYPVNCPTDPGHASLGALYFQRGLFAEAASEYETAVALRPSNKDYHYRLAQSYERGGRIPDAVREYLQVLELDANDLGAKQALARLSNQ